MFKLKNLKKMFKLKNLKKNFSYIFFLKFKRTK